MDFLLQLWLPIAVSAAAVFVMSSIIWMASPLHKHDYKDPGDKEETILSMVRGGGFEPGVYFVPWCKGKKDPAAAEKMKAGPWVLMIVMSQPSFGKSLGMWFFNSLLISLFAGYIGSVTLSHGLGFSEVFQVLGTAALLGYAGYAIPMSTWHGLPWRQLPGRLVDGVIYAAITGAVFAWLWPKAAGPVIEGLGV